MLTQASSPCIEDDFSPLDAVAQAALVRSGEVSSLELVDAAIRRIERMNPLVNAVVHSDFERARQQAKGPLPNGLLAGVPVLLKDLLAYPGLACGYGTRALHGQPAQFGSAYTEAIDRAGMIVLGKSTTSELGILGTTETLACGPTRNPFDLQRSTGGSSGGAAAAVACGMVPVAHASDGGGSIRGPTSFCGLFGFKPSRGRHVSTGAVMDSPFGSILSEHCVSRSVRDSAAWLSVTERRDGALEPIGFISGPAAKRLRIGVYRHTAFGALPDPEVDAALQRTTTMCREFGHRLVECTAPTYAAAEASEAFFAMAAAGAAGFMLQLGTAQGIEPLTQALASQARGNPLDAMRRGLEVMDRTMSKASHPFDRFDVLLCPTVPFPAFPLGLIGPGTPLNEVIAFTHQLAGYTALASMAGWCAMSVPLASSSSGLPIGMHFSAPSGADAMLLQLAYELEAAAT